MRCGMNLPQRTQRSQLPPPLVVVVDLSLSWQRDRDYHGRWSGLHHDGACGSYGAVSDPAESQAQQFAEGER